jgi:hypothetical protein
LDIGALKKWVNMAKIQRNKRKKKVIFLTKIKSKFIDQVDANAPVSTKPSQAIFHKPLILENY